ncbi:MAG: TRAP transporter small permease [Clostridia bacterium]|nr:TRAP transporter small permease [Clostridia bacterium]
MKIVKWLDENLEKVLCVALFMIIAAFMILNVFMRYVLNSAISWATDLVLFLFVWFVWLAISYGIRVGSHVNVTAFIDLFPRKVGDVFAVFCDLLIIVGFAWLMYYGIALLLDKSVALKYGLLVRYPMWSLYLSVPAGLGLCIVRMAQKTILSLLLGDLSVCL